MYTVQRIRKEYMQAKTKIDFSGTIGTNDPKVTQDQLAEILFDLEVEFNNKHPNLRMHIFADKVFQNYKPKRKTTKKALKEYFDENKERDIK